METSKWGRRQIIDPNLKIFLFGFGGSAAIEIVSLYVRFETAQSSRVVLPWRYRKVSFWIVRFMIAIIAGGLAVAYGINNMILAINIGASAPLILQAFAQGLNFPVSTAENSASGPGVPRSGTPLRRPDDPVGS